MKSTLSQVGEFGLIRKIISQLPPLKKSVILGPGDDCAAIRTRSHATLLLTTDMLIEGIHFSRDWMKAEQIGFKAMRVNLSDMAAMGGEPLYALLSVGLPPSTKTVEAERLIKGILKAARETHVSILGGDTNASQNWMINITLIGTPFYKNILTRKGARVGDIIYVTGTLGGSALGLAALRKKKSGLYRSFIQQHIVPPNRISVGKRLSFLPGVHSMIDISDGFLGDLGHILEESSVSAKIAYDHIPTPPRFLKSARQLGQDPDFLKLSGGEDYELLFTASPKAKIPGRISGVPITPVGTIQTRKRSFLKTPLGFSHFSNDFLLASVMS